MKIGFYGATGSNDFGDYAMMIHNINRILSIDKNSDIYIFTPDKFCTLNNLIHNMDIDIVKNNLHIVDEPNLEGTSFTDRLNYLFFKTIHKDNLLFSRFKSIEKKDYKYINKSFLDTVLNLDVLIFNGGGYLQESWREKNINFVVACLVAQQNNIPVYFLGNSIGPLDKYEEIVMNTMKKVDGIIVRDGNNYTAKLLDSYGQNKYTVASDDLLFVNDYYEYKQIYDNYVVIEVMFYITKAKKGANYIIEELIKFINIVSKEKNVLLLNFDVDGDLANHYIDYIYNQVNDKDKVYVRHATENIYEMFGYYKYADFSISFKYHPLILSLGSNVPCVGIVCDNNGYYEGKIKGAFESCGIDYHNKVMHIDEFSLSKLLEMYRENNSKTLYNISDREGLKEKYTAFLKKCLKIEG